jgi:hypothetical protein
MMELSLLSIVAGILCLPRAVASQHGEYSQAKAIEYAYLSGAAYCSEDKLNRWNCSQCNAPLHNVKVCHSSDMTQAFVGRWHGDCAISFEGTETWKSMWTDVHIYTQTPVKVWPGCKADGKGKDSNDCEVHAGYYKDWLSLRPCIIRALDANGCTNKNSAAGANGSQLRVTGHSLGAAVAAIAMMDLEDAGWTVREAYNFGMPRTGNWQFAKGFMNQFTGRFWRVTHHKDLIVQVPLPMRNISWTYSHTGLEAFYDGEVSQGYKICMAPEDPNCSKQYWDVLFDDWSMKDHLFYMGVEMGKHGCGETPVAEDEDYFLKHKQDFMSLGGLPQTAPTLVV